MERDARPLEPFVGWSFVLMAAGLLLAARSFPWGRLPPFCVFNIATDLPCLTCGMTRSWVALTHGDLAEALAWNPGGALLCVLTLLGGAYAAARQLGAPALRWESSRRERALFRVALVLGIAVNWSFVALSGRV